MFCFFKLFYNISFSPFRLQYVFLGLNVEDKLLIIFFFCYFFGGVLVLVPFCTWKVNGCCLGFLKDEVSGVLVLWVKLLNQYAGEHE